jgi:hypothetical protein
MVDLVDLVHVYDDVLDSQTCQKLIDFYESNEELHEKISNNGTPNFTQINLTENHKQSDEIKSIHNLLISKVFEYKKLYYDFIDARCFPNEHAFEQFRIKKYNLGGEDRFDTHVDVKDYASARRFLSFFWYLNEVDEGGETIFADKIIKPKTGKLVVFPPLWMYPHRGAPPTSNPKYIMSTYLHYK